jgi:hypothetical protein
VDRVIHSDYTSSPTAIRDEWSSADDQNEEVDQFKVYINELWAQVSIE